MQLTLTIALGETGGPKDGYDAYQLIAQSNIPHHHVRVDGTHVGETSGDFGNLGEWSIAEPSTELSDAVTEALAELRSLDADEERWTKIFDDNGDMTTDEYEERDDTRAGHVDSLALALRNLLAVVNK